MTPVGAKVKRLYRRFTTFLRLNSGHLWLFFAVNFVFGAFGIWASLIAGNWISDSWWQPLLTQFDNAAPYTFAIAFLASTASYVAVEYLDKRAITWKQWKVVLTVVASILIVVCGVLSTLQTVLPQKQSQSASASPPSHEVNDDPKGKASITVRGPAVEKPKERLGLPPRHVLQGVLVSISFITGFLIFVTFLALSDPMKRALAEFDEELDEESDALIRASKARTRTRGASR